MTRKMESTRRLTSGIAVLLWAVLAALPAMAGNPTPTGPPASPGPRFTLGDVYLRLTTGAPGNASPHTGPFMDPTSGPPTSSMFTVDQILLVAPAQDAANGAAPAQVLSGKTFWGLQPGGGWGPQTGTMVNQGAASFTPAATPQTITAGYYNGGGTVAGDPNLVAGNIKSGTTIFGTAGTFTSGATAAATDILLGKTAYANGALVTGSITTQTLSSASTTVNAGYYAATTLNAVDPNLAAGNIKSGTTIFGVAGSVIQSTGTAVAANVLAGSTFSNAAAAGLTGTMPVQALSSASTAVNAGYYAATTLNAVDPNLATGNIKSGITIFGVAGTPTVVDTAGATAAAGDISTGKTAYVAGSLVTGTLSAGQTAAQPGKTGQTGCWDASGMAFSCTGTGQDGDTKEGVAWPNPRFTDNGNGTVTDNLTKLIWLKNANCFGTPNWAAALASANGLASPGCGLNDGSTAGQWRLPNRFEMESLLDLQYISPPVSNVDGLTGPCGTGGTCAFTGIQKNWYWTASTYAPYPAGAWVVDLLNGGYVGGGVKTNTNYVWPVRGGQ